ncbi:hypothetical protein E5673_14260 [Sphingomonas sp. PAMC26645]|uniref:hypothetical protein n=1 Tax=Sphingomonas sp. PAMC26645 TaxID=2565555 RepID=UPI00109DA2E0|nr:hypothetical protein [Sphingomonas sp. PAMC26645]QCB43244.1 hypothetical protein E5673_14260 [Sphingomonas sp. PAMC26645]
MNENEPENVPESPQELIETALIYRIRAQQRFVALAEPLGSEAAADKIAALTDKLHAAYDALNKKFQAHVRAKEYTVAGCLKGPMDNILLLIYALSKRVIQMYERDAAAASKTLADVLERIGAATRDFEADTENWGRLGGAINAAATAIGIVT